MRVWESDGGALFPQYVALLVVVVVLALVVTFVVLVRLGTDSNVAVQQEIAVVGSAYYAGARVDQLLERVVLAYPDLELRQRAPGQASLVRRRRPAWAVLLAILCFPLGLLALSAREEVVLEVSTFERAGSTVVRLSGRTPSPALALLQRRLASAAATSGRSGLPQNWNMF